MTNERDGLLAVRTGLVLETLVEDVFARVEERRAEAPPAEIAAVLGAEHEHLAGKNDAALDYALRHAGYLARVIEVELFAPARAAAEWVPGMLRERFARTNSWPEAVSGACSELAAAEPLGKPSPEDGGATSWRIPGPGGHVRHYLARRTIEEHLRAREEPIAGDPAELKRPWLYGFFVRACEEALPDEATLGTAH